AVAPRLARARRLPLRRGAVGGVPAPSTRLDLRLFPAPATPDIYPLSLHDALPISPTEACSLWLPAARQPIPSPVFPPRPWRVPRSEEHTSELQSRENLVCRLLLEKKKPYIPG